MTLVDSLNPEEQLKRQRRMELFSLAAPSVLEDFLLSLDEIPPYVFLKKPSSGLVMVRGRIGGTGALFNLGELLISRSVVEMEGTLGFGYTPFENLRHSEMAAVLDALASHPKYENEVFLLTEKLRKLRFELTNSEEKESERTKVEFFTVKRGEDE
jgi:alpha-D-ribose 1-methylphosphonate 5-triphosphate synthase subunit PhnG